MKIVFQASTGVEAHMVRNLLQQEGIEADVEGEYLQGGVGELQAINVVRVVVADRDFERARGIVARWEAEQPEFEPEPMAAANRFSAGFAGFLAGLVLGVGGMFWAYSTPVTTSGIDYDGDGTLELKWINRDGRHVRTEVDRNRDGEPDEVVHFDRHQTAKSARYDDDFDGVFETWSDIRLGNPFVTKTDVDADGHIDYRVEHKYGVAYKAVITGNEPGSPTKEQFFEHGKVVKTRFDEDGDGTFDRETTYDWYEEPVETIRLTE